MLPAAAGVPCRPQLGRVVESARPDPDQPISWRAGNPRTAIGANPSRRRPAAVGKSLERARFDAAKPERRLGDHHPHAERAAGQTLAIPTMTGVDLDARTPT